MKKIFTPGDVAKILEKAKSTVSEWIHAEKLKARKSPGGNWQILRPDLIEFMNEYDCIARRN
jgi:excisionase family DNA binding protein